MNKKKLISLLCIFVLFSILMGCEEKDKGGGGPVFVNGPKYIIAGSSDNVFVLEPYGYLWSLSSNGGVGHIWTSIIKTNDGTIIGGNDDGIYSSPDNGYTWVLKQSTTKAVNTLLAVGPDNAIAGTNDGILLSKDGGHTWGNVTINSPIAGTIAIKAFALLGSGHIIATGAKEGLLDSADNGANWTVISGSPSSFGAMTVLNDNISIMACDESNKGIYISHNKGASWTQTGQTGQTCISIKGLPDGTVLAGYSSGGIKRTVDNGTHWTITKSQNIFPWNGFDVLSDNKTVLGITNGVQISYDDGNTWNEILHLNKGLMFSLLVIKDWGDQ